jgi:creatinine amidohydrolase/Fe(II)-dependent formamide hydrolase-like protein
MPPLAFGLNEHPEDLPGVIRAQPENLIVFVMDVAKSLADHGFRLILLPNSHGSKQTVLDLTMGGGKVMLRRRQPEVTRGCTTGDTILANPETGGAFLRAAIEEATASNRAIPVLPIRARKDHH